MRKDKYIDLARKNTSFFSNFFNLSFIQISNAAIQLLLFPIIIRLIGMESFGLVAVTNAYAGLIGLFINYGTNLSGIKDVAINKKDTVVLSKLFYGIYQTRLSLFLLAGIIPVVLLLMKYEHIQYLLFATPIILAEAVNPLFFFNGIEKLVLFNSANLLAKLSSALLIICFINTDSNPWWVNFYLGFGNMLFYSLLAFYAIHKYQLSWQPFSKKIVGKIVKENFYLVSNNLSVHLQQSFFLFLLPFVSTPLVLGAYSLCDKVIWSFRLLIVAFSGAIYPKAALSYQTQKEKWVYYKKRINTFLAIAFLFTSFFLFFGNQLLVQLFTGSKDDLAALYIRSIALVPLFTALNSLNVIELLIKNQYRLLFYSSMVMLCVTTVTSLLFAYINQINYYGYYPFIIEASTIPITLYFLRIHKRSNQ